MNLGLLTQAVQGRNACWRLPWSADSPNVNGRCEVIARLAGNTGGCGELPRERGTGMEMR